MPTISSTLSLAKQALIAQQGAMAAGSDNVANVNTPGYARRKGILQTAPTDRTLFGGLGSGVLKLIAAMPPAREQPKVQTPAKEAAPADEPKASKPEQQPGVDLLISLLKKDLDREIAAAKRVAEDPQAQEPLPPKPPEPAAPTPK